MSKTVDIENIAPSELYELWNSENTIGVEINPHGRVKHDFAEHSGEVRNAGMRHNVNFLKYAAFLASPVNRKGRVKLGVPKGYEAQKARAAQRSAQLSQAGRDIGELPEVADPKRKKSCKRDFRKFCEVYFCHIFNMEWSDDHLKAIAKIEQSVLKGGLFALAMPRGSGKSSLCEAAGVWSVVYGHREFVTLIGATESAALEMMDSVKTELESNELLAADFPEVCYPIEQLDGIANRCAGQLYRGKRTKITWTANEIVLPTIEDSAASGVVIRVAGLTGRVRGMKFKRSDGRSVRPELVIVDDPQTSESANSIEQTRKRLRILSGDILGLAGPGKKISGLMPCTVIKTGDMADQILDKSKHPEWNGERCKMLYSLPTNEKLWEQYAEIRAQSLREKGDISDATAFYAENRKAMDEGAVVAWKQRHNPDELSALQHAMNLRLQDELAFMAEYQNEPLSEDKAEDTLMSVDEICSKLNGLKKKVVPLNCVRLTMFVDVQKTVLYYCVCAWADDFTGAVIDYGAYPEQGRIRFTLNDVKPTMQDLFPKSGFEGQLYGTLEKLFDERMTERYLREDGAEMQIERALIDANWGASTDTVYQFCRQTVYSNVVMPGHGRYIGASTRSMTSYRRKPGERIGFNWMMPNIAGKRAIRHVIFDTNFWKSFVHSRLSVAMGDKGCLSLYGKNPLYHLMFAEHLTAEYRVKTEGLGRTVDEWKLRPDRNDNHFLDCLAGCAVCASIQGSTLDEQFTLGGKRKPIRLSSLAQGDGGTPVPQTEPVNEPQMPEKKGPLRLSDLQKNRRY